MTELFIKTLNVSISASWLILAVLLFRLLIRKVPKWVNILLWGIVAIRLISPSFVESAFSLIPSTQVVSPSVLLEEPEITIGFPEIDEAVNPIIEESQIVTAPEKSGNALKILLRFSSRIWGIGVALLLLYTVISYWCLKHRVRTAVHVEDNIYQSENVISPFVLGIIKPRVYLPFSISEQSMMHILAHERAHIQRKDHWWKPFGFLLLSVHWFNPFMWLSYCLLCRDIELACDEKVVKDWDTGKRADYSAALLSCSVSRYRIAACPVAFGEVSPKTRIKSVLNYKKPGFWVLLIALMLCAIVAVCFLTNPIGSSGAPDLSFLNYENAISLVADREEVQVIYCPPSQKGADHAIKVGAVCGRDLAVYLDNCVWRTVNAPNSNLPSPGSIEFVIEDDHRIQIYQRKGISLHGYAAVTYADETRYYAISNSDYENAVELLYGPKVIAEDNLWKLTQEGTSYYLSVGSEDVTEIGISTPSTSGGCVNADGSSFRIGERVWLEQLEGIDNLDGVAIQATDTKGNILFFVSFPLSETYQNLESNTVQYLADESSILPTDQWLDGIAFADLKPNEEQTSEFEILFVKETNSLQYSITWSRTGLTLEYGLRSSDGSQCFSSVAEGGHDRGQIDKIPAGTYYLFVRNTDYIGYTAYENPELFPYVSYNATGVINIRVP